jgi:hypothetical protein
MKKIIFTFLILSMISFASYSQKLGLGFKAGVTSNNLTFKSGVDFKETGQKTGTYFGFTYQYQVSEHFVLQPNLFAVMKGAEIEEADITTWHISMPINLLYTHQGFFIGGGPNLALGLDARAKGEDLEPDGEIDLYSNESILKMKRFEIGTNATMGYNFNNGLSITANYAQVLNDLNDTDGDYKISSSSFGIAVGYNFGKKRK